NNDDPRIRQRPNMLRPTKPATSRSLRGAVTNNGPAENERQLHRQSIASRPEERSPPTRRGIRENIRIELKSGRDSAAAERKPNRVRGMERIRPTRASLIIHAADSSSIPTVRGLDTDPRIPV